ncbi:hypothetical protein SLEP1_g40693 [Rubroshorea leprosula]|uniref:Uncharacterized protein n=1 Tax=Rubroshorea leprosula TaxID=152421 RepID=A0AAV5L4D9_9ROSI|nr:hypothetical protein SLEP1_g40693 [Rubroshorea leprosula]
MEEKIIQQKNHQQGSSSYGGKKASKKKPHNSALRFRTNSNLAMKASKARGRNIGILRPMVKTLVEMMEAKTVEVRCDGELTKEIVATAEDMKLDLDLLKISIFQHSHDMLRISGAVDKLAEVMLLQLD